MRARLVVQDPAVSHPGAALGRRDESPVWIDTVLETHLREELDTAASVRGTPRRRAASGDEAGRSDSSRTATRRPAAPRRRTPTGLPAAARRAAASRLVCCGPAVPRLDVLADDRGGAARLVVGLGMVRLNSPTSSVTTLRPGSARVRSRNVARDGVIGAMTARGLLPGLVFVRVELPVGPARVGGLGEDDARARVDQHLGGGERRRLVADARRAAAHIRRRCRIRRTCSPSSPPASFAASTTRSSVSPLSAGRIRGDADRKSEIVHDGAAPRRFGHRGREPQQLAARSRLQHGGARRFVRADDAVAEVDRRHVRPRRRREQPPASRRRRTGRFRDPRTLPGGRPRTRRSRRNEPALLKRPAGPPFNQKTTSAGCSSGCLRLARGQSSERERARERRAPFDRRPPRVIRDPS